MPALNRQSVWTLAGATSLCLVFAARASSSDTVTVSFSVPHCYKLYDPSVDTAPIDSGMMAPSVTLTLSDHPQILQLLD